jgi:alpha-ketoglutarate-dependent taurine dioxygenase
MLEADSVATLDLGDEVALAVYEPGGWPVVVEARTNRLRQDESHARSWFQEHKVVFDRALADVGALILRGFALSDARSFSRFIQHYPSMPYGSAGGAAKRSEVADRVYDTVQSRAPTSRIGMHQEMSYLPVFPKQIAFFCHVPATTHGETLIADMRSLERLVSPRLFDGIKEKGIRYVRSTRAPGARVEAPEEHQDYLRLYYQTWSDSYGTTDRDEVERKVQAAGQDFEWLPDGGLTTSYASPGFVSHPLTGSSEWFNSISISHGNYLSADLPPDVYARAFPAGASKPFDVLFGDGTPLREDDVLELCRILDSSTVAPRWRAGDLMLLDNILTAHGGNAWTGPRDILVSMFG